MPAIILLSELVTPSTADEVLELELNLATQLGLPVTSWQPLDPSRTIMQTEAALGAQTSATIASIAQGGYISYAAVMPAGTSPYNDGAGFLTTWMDLRGYDVYNVVRFQPTAASGPMPVNNATATAQPYTAGQLHFQHPTSGATYTNTANGTAAASGLSNVLVQADPAYVGPIGTLSIGQTAELLTPLPGLSAATQAVALVGNPIETNAHYLVRCVGKLSSLSPNGAPGAYTYAATSVPVFGSTLYPPSDILDLSQSPVASISSAANALLSALGFTAGSQLFSAPTSENPWGVTTPVTRAITVLDIGTGIVRVYVANSTGTIAGCAQNEIAAITWSGGVVSVQTDFVHGLVIGNYVIFSGVQGATGVNNSVAGTPAWQVTNVTSTNNFQFALSTNPGTYTGGGSIEGGDLGMVDAAIQAQVVPDGQTALTYAATPVAVNVTATVYLSTKSGISVAAAQNAISTALADYLASVPIGGLNAELNGIVPGSELLVQIANANPGTVSVTPTPSDVFLSADQVPVLGTIAINVVFV